MKSFFIKAEQCEDILTFRAWNNDFFIEEKFDVKLYNEEAIDAEIMIVINNYNKLFGKIIDDRFCFYGISIALNNLDKTFECVYRLSYAESLPIPYPCHLTYSVLEKMNEYDYKNYDHAIKDTKEVNNFINHCCHGVYVENCKIYNDWLLFGDIIRIDDKEKFFGFVSYPGYTITSNNDGKPVLNWPGKTSEDSNELE